MTADTDSVPPVPGPSTGLGLRRQTEAVLEGLQQRLASEVRRREAMQASWSWRVTRPARWLGKRLARAWGRPTPADDAGGHPAPPAADTGRTRLVAEADAELSRFLADGARLALPIAPTPRLSIVLVLFNQAGLTLRCLRSIAATADLPLEVILVDNGSTDATIQLLERVDGAGIVRSSANLHYLRGVNLGAGHARGDLLLLLNNDTELTAGSLAAAMAVLDDDRTVGAVGGRLVHPNGRLQEAGSIVWRDGSCFNYGRGHDPDAGPYMFQRDVDFCSGAFLMTRRALFETMGRFDEALAPAYYEETDFCLRLWQDGHRVVFDPRVLVHHFEFASGPRGDALALMRRNQAIFAARHRARLASSHMIPVPENPLPARSRDWGRVIGRILIVTACTPLDGQNPSERRLTAMVGALQGAGWFVSLYPLTDRSEHWPDVRRTLAITTELVLCEGTAGLQRFLRERTGYYDCIVACGPACLELLLADAAAPVGSSVIVYDAGPTVSSPLTRDRELVLAGRAALIVAVSEAEADRFRRLERSGIWVVSEPELAEPAVAPDAANSFPVQMRALLAALDPGIRDRPKPWSASEPRAMA
jgi:GT2 family glycosyltransferase